MTTAYCPETEKEISVGNPIPGKPGNFRQCLESCRLARPNTSEGALLTEGDTGLVVSRCTRVGCVLRDPEKRDTIDVSVVYG